MSELAGMLVNLYILVSISYLSLMFFHPLFEASTSISNVLVRTIFTSNFVKLNYFAFCFPLIFLFNIS